MTISNLAEIYRTSPLLRDLDSRRISKTNPISSQEVLDLGVDVLSIAGESWIYERSHFHKDKETSRRYYVFFRPPTFEKIRQGLLVWMT